MDLDVANNSIQGCRSDFGKNTEQSSADKSEFDEIVNVEGKEDVMDKNRAVIPKEKIPYIGMEFDSEKAACRFYNEYARLIGFGTRKHTQHPDVTGRIVYRTFVCACEGMKKKDKRDVLVKRPRAETRTNCGARMTVNARHTGKFTVTEFVPEHIGHDFVSQDQIHLLRSHRNINDVQATQIENIDKSGIAPKAGLDFMAQQAGGREQVGFTLADMKNYLYLANERR